jgi:hypothetical protein
MVCLLVACGDFYEFPTSEPTPARQMKLPRKVVNLVVGDQYRVPVTFTPADVSTEAVWWIPADDAIARFIDDRGYEMENDQLEAGRLTYFLKIVTGVVLAVGLLISILSFYILMLSVYLLLQKNTTKLENLLLIGYSPARVSLPYQLLTISVNFLVLVIAIGLLLWIRSQYMNLLWSMFPQIEEASIVPAILCGLAIFVVVSIFNIIAIRRRVNLIWQHKE